MSNALTPPGTSARQAQATQISSASGALTGALPGLSDLVKQQQGWYANQIPGFQSAVQSLGQMTTSGGRQQMADANQNLLHGQALSQAANTYGQFAGNPMLAQAFGLNALNNANQAGSQYLNQISSPEAMLRAVNQYGQGLQMAAPSYGALQGVAGAALGQPLMATGDSGFGALASLIGTLK